MTTVGEHIQSTDAAICQNIASLVDQRDLLSQNVLAHLRNLVEGVAVRLRLGSADAEYNYPAIGLGLAFVKAKGQYSFLSRFHKLLEASASHYTLDGDASERSSAALSCALPRDRRDMTVPIGTSSASAISW